MNKLFPWLVLGENQEEEDDGGAGRYILWRFANNTGVCWLCMIRVNQGSSNLSVFAGMMNL